MMKWILAVFLALSVVLNAKADGYREIVLAPVGTVVTATGNQTTVDTRVYDIPYNAATALFLVDVSAVSGTTPSATFALQATVNGVVFTVASCTAITAVAQCVVQLPSSPTNVRVSYTISGTTPSFTFSAYLVRQ